jgi:hypothetical protein
MKNASAQAVVVARACAPSNDPNRTSLPRHPCQSMRWRMLRAPVRHPSCSTSCSADDEAFHAVTCRRRTTRDGAARTRPSAGGTTTRPSAREMAVNERNDRTSGPPTGRAARRASQVRYVPPHGAVVGKTVERVGHERVHTRLLITNSLRTYGPLLVDLLKIRHQHMPLSLGATSNLYPRSFHTFTNLYCPISSPYRFLSFCYRFFTFVPISSFCRHLHFKANTSLFGNLKDVLQFPLHALRWQLKRLPPTMQCPRGNLHSSNLFCHRCVTRALPSSYFVYLLLFLRT